MKPLSPGEIPTRTGIPCMLLLNGSCSRNNMNVQVLSMGACAGEWLARVNPAK